MNKKYELEKNYGSNKLLSELGLNYQLLAKKNNHEAISKFTTLSKEIPIKSKTSPKFEFSDKQKKVFSFLL